MTHVVNKRHSLYYQLIVLLITSALAAGTLFLIINYAGSRIIDSYILSSKYIKKQDTKYISKLQNYVEQNNIKIDDVNTINTWVNKQRVINLEIYHNGLLVYDSEYPEFDSIWKENISYKHYEKSKSYTIKFDDADATVCIYGIYDYQFYTFLMIGNLIVSFIFFLILVLCGIHKKMHYILLLSNEIEILEGGNLEYNITVKGKDELALLANGLDCMRQSFSEQLKQKAEMDHENQRIITQMSHDLRTPITSIMLYTEIIKKGAFEDKDKLLEYLNKIESKSTRMKQLTDYLFEYSLVSGESEITLENPETFKVLFYDLLSETCSYLKQKGHVVMCNVSWYTYNIQVNYNYLTRIMDNITSNIIKYSDPADFIYITAYKEKNMIGFSFVNTIKKDTEDVDSNGIGINSIKNMMNKMNGKCIVKKDTKFFEIHILFPIIEDEP